MRGNGPDIGTSRAGLESREWPASGAVAAVAPAAATRLEGTGAFEGPRFDYSGHPMGSRTSRKAGTKRREARAGGGGALLAALAPAWPPIVWAVALAAIGALALALRLSFQAKVAVTPLAGILTADALVYWRWAGHILRHGIVGRNLWFFGPLYPYVLAGLRMLASDSIPTILATQAVWGAAAVVLLADAARRLTRPLVGLLVGVAVAAYPMAVFFDDLVLMESLLFFAQALLLWWVARTDWPRTRIAGPLVLGALVGVLAEGRATAALLLLPALLLLGPWRGALRAASLRVLALALGFGAIVMPVAARNVAVSGRLVPFTYNFGFNLWVGNGPGATGSWRNAPEAHFGNVDAGSPSEGGVDADGREYLRTVQHVSLDPVASSRWWSAIAWREMGSHPVRALGLQVRKLGMLWNRREYPQIENVDEYREIAGPPGATFLGGFAALAVLALAGARRAWTRGATGRFLLAGALLVTLGTAAFFVTDRYRHQVVPFVALLAAFGVEGIGEAIASRSRASIAWLGAGAAAGLALAFAPAPGLGAAAYREAVAADIGMRWLQRGRADLAVGFLERAVRYAEAAGAEMPADARATLDYNYGAALEQTGRAADAVGWYERALRASPAYADAMRALALAYDREGRTAQADSLEQRLALVPGGAASVLAGEGWDATRAGRFADAERAFHRALRMDAHLYNEWGALVRLQIQAGRLDAAESTLVRARDAGLPRPASRAHEALIAALRGRRLDAEAALADVPQALIASDPTIADVVRLTRQVLSRK